MKSSMIKIVCLALLLLGIQTGLKAQMGPQEAVSLMKRGINMGNTLEPPREGDWQEPAREAYFDLYLEAGFDVVRIPVRWDEHTSHEAPYHVENSWMDRVEEVVEWGLSRDLFIVLNTHHEEWIKSAYADPSNRARFDSIWSQIAVRFKDKPEKLIFEIINEPKGLTKTQNNELHQRVLDIIRLSNPTRNVIIQGHEWGGADQLITMTIPDDDYLIGSFHSYDPWPFGLEGTGTFGSTYQLQSLENKFIKVKEWSDESGLPVFLGEFACHRSADYNSRMKHYRAYVNFSQKYGFTPCSWDDGGNFAVMLRSSLDWNEIKDILIYCDPGSPTIKSLTIEQDTIVSLKWSNGTGGHDSLTIQRKTGNGKFRSIARLQADSTSFRDENPDQAQNLYYRIIAHHPDGIIKHSNPLFIHMPEYLPKVRKYYLGKAHTIPGIIEAEDFDEGGEGLSYHDLDQKNIAGDYRPDEAVDIFAIGSEAYFVGNAFTGEWIEYGVDVEEAGVYSVDVHCSSVSSGGQFCLSLGEVCSDTTEVKSSDSWIDTDITSLELYLNQGEQIMRFTIISDPWFYIDRFEFTLNTTGNINQSLTKQELRVYQETGGDLIITLDERIHVIELYNLKGSLESSVSNPDPVHRISGSSLKNGIYLLRAFTDQGVRVKKVFIQK